MSQHATDIIYALQYVENFVSALLLGILAHCLCVTEKLLAFSKVEKNPGAILIVEATSSFWVIHKGLYGFYDFYALAKLAIL